MSDHDEPRTKSGKGLPGWLIGVFVAGGLIVICVGASLFGAVSILVPRIQQRQAQTTCADHLIRLNGLYLNDRAVQGAAPTEGGAAYFVRLARESGSDPALLVCPRDPVATAAPAFGATPPASDDAAALRAICSYAVRDFARHPLDEAATDELIAADAQAYHESGVDADGEHALGINVLRSDGSVRFMGRAALGLAPDDDRVPSGAG